MIKKIIKLVVGIDERARSDATVTPVTAAFFHFHFFKLNV